MRRGSLLIIVLVVLLSGTGMVRAHERRTVGGKYDVEVGWDKEPAYVNQPNAAVITIYKAGTQDAVTGVEQTLKVRIAFGGGQPKEFPLRASFNKKGQYTAEIVPTRAGSYIFTFVGEIEGTPVNEAFESGPGRFDDVDDMAALQFPQPAPDPLMLANQIRTAQNDAANARLFGIIGIAVGIIGVVVGGAALATRRRG
ncbi:MAG: hypothetical protein IT324_08985 [Anaerolineae bacterium]|nr:hypothetical protein [Anaerolineae bacterium]